MTDFDDRDPMDRLAALEALCAKQGAELVELRGIIRAIGVAIVGGGPEVAEDYDLDSKFGDPVIRKDPTANFWKGASHVGRPMSQCEPEYLDAFAKYKDVCASLDEKKGTPDKLKFAGYARKDAARARGWAKRIRGGWTPPKRPSVATPFGGGAGFGHAFGGEDVSFGGGGNPFAASAGPTESSPDLFGDGRPKNAGDAFEPLGPDDNDAAEPLVDLDDVDDLPTTADGGAL